MFSSESKEILASDAKMTVVFGGAFNPVHRDHIRLVDTALLQPACQEVWVMPSPDRPDKQIKTSFYHRLAMLKIAFQTQIAAGQVQCRTDEMQWGYAGTYRLLLHLQQTFPERQFAWLVGSDSLPLLPQWIEGDKLLQDFSFWVFPRQNIPVHAFPEARITDLSSGVTHEGVYSSTQIRQAIRQGGVQQLAALPSEIREYILCHRLYRD